MLLVLFTNECFSSRLRVNSQHHEISSRIEELLHGTCHLKLSFDSQCCERGKILIFFSGLQLDIWNYWPKNQLLRQFFKAKWVHPFSNWNLYFVVRIEYNIWNRYPKKFLFLYSVFWIKVIFLVRKIKFYVEVQIEAKLKIQWDL